MSTDTVAALLALGGLAVTVLVWSRFAVLDDADASAARHQGGAVEAAGFTSISRSAAELRRLRERAWFALSSFGAMLLGLAPHVLHHAGPLAGAALFAGFGGSLLFGALGLIAAVPMLRKVHVRTGNWRVPSALLALFATVFALSTFVVGPAIAGGGNSSSGKAAPAAPQQPSGHEAHH